MGLCKNQLEATQKGLKSSQDYLATQTNQLATQATELARYKADADSLKMALTSTEYQLNQVTAEKARLQETANKAQNSSFVSQREWQSSVDWSINNTGQVVQSRFGTHLDHSVPQSSRTKADPCCRRKSRRRVPKSPLGILASSSHASPKS